MASPRDHIRAAQAAELRGDKATAVSELWRAAALYREAGNPARALQILRHARTLDPSRVDLAEEVSRLEWLPDTSIDRDLQEPDARELELKMTVEPTPEMLERQRLIEAALQQASLSGRQAQEDEVRRWLVEEPSEGGRRTLADLQAASQRALEWALEKAGDEKPPREWTLDEPPAKGHPSEVALEVRAVVTDDMRAVVAEVEPPAELSEPEPTPGEFQLHEPRAKEAEPEAPPERALIERGPTRADPAVDAWCSFCCRPRAEVGELVSGPTGSFICAGCVGESRALLGGEAAPSARARPARRTAEEAGAFELVGQKEAQALLEQGILAGARRMLILGPPGTGKSTWFQALARREVGTLVTVDALEQGASGGVFIVEDVDRLSPEVQGRLAAFLARHPERTVLMSARGALEAPPRLVLRGGAGKLPVLTTSALSQAVQGAVPETLLEQVQLVAALTAPTEAEYVEIAQRRLAPRAPEVTVSPEVLAAFAAEAVRSPRAGHELNALLARVLAGAWSLETDNPAPKRTRRKRTSS